MKTYADKNQENQSRSTASIERHEQKKGSAFQIIDNRPEAIQRQRLQELADNRPKNAAFHFVDNRPGVAQMKRLQELATNRSTLHQLRSMYEKSSAPPIQRLVFGGENNDAARLDEDDLLDEIAERIRGIGDRVVQQWYERNTARINGAIVSLMHSDTTHRTINQIVLQIVKRARQEEKENIKPNQDSSQSDDEEDRTDRGSNRVPFRPIGNLQSR